ncbi:nuclear transport factor 2 family protein [Paenibacillus polymyxa]|uniref:nuclear transport factor 2 family protein n=1 Tax=Paenibacillus polymyxa TaxID=1406 RepID=UPI002AB4B33A|nr:nuclear transport factor 2 family protein [Paenibacillus polymyxa]MDY8093404.1 nuclear transport factor 2 family protein [Paenibacillus polymyxa]
MKILEDYFHYYDLAKDDEKSRERLISLFSEKIEFVLNGDRKQGMNSWKSFLNMFSEGSLEIKHMYEGWKPVPREPDTYQTKWAAVCGKKATGEVYTLTGVDKARLDAEGKIVYLENIPDTANAFDKYKNI